MSYKAYPGLNPVYFKLEITFADVLVARFPEVFNFQKLAEVVGRETYRQDILSQGIARSVSWVFQPVEYDLARAQQFRLQHYFRRHLSTPYSITLRGYDGHGFGVGDSE